MKNLVILLSFIILLSNITLAASPFISANQGGCQITPIVREYLKTNVSFDFNFHVFNFTNGVPLSNTTLDCVFHFYNQTGDHVFSTKLKNDPFSEHEIINEWAERMDGGNISTNGNYAYIVQCNGTNTGCSDKGSFIVTSNGFPLPSEFVIVFFSIIYIISGFGIAFVILYSIGHLLKLDFDLKDFALNLGTYFAIIMIYYLQSY